ncbi:MAG: transcription elongation factor GreA [Erysipelotrichaceae bacterium]|jgi:transcription elongation factor GreA|nr:transcription elongation factor GreA [Erysipelotrichaceae bacterium]
MADKTKLTKEGKAKLEAELRHLIDIDREEVKAQLKEARAQGDLSENADYDAARARQAEVEGRITEIENILANAEIIEEKKGDSKKVGLGSTVEVEYLEIGKKGTYTIVGSVESDPFQGKISNDCPLGSALIGKKEGDIIDVKGNKPYQVKIIKLTK